MKKILCFLFFTGLVHAEPLPSLQIESVTTPLGGENTHDPSWRMTSKFSPYMRNVTVDGGRIEGVAGYQTLGSTRTLSKVTGIFPFKRENGNTTFLVTDSSVTLETADFKTYILVSSASNTGSLLNWLQVRNKMWGYNGIDFVKTWDGSVTNILNGNNNTPNVPKFKYGQCWQERVWGFNNPSVASSLDFSSVVTTDAIIINPDDSRAWPVTNSLKIGQGDGEVGTALWVKNGQLKVGKERSKYTIYGTNVSNYFARKDISNSVGVISNDSVVNLDNATYYLSQGGIYRDEDRISDLIEPDIETFSRGVQKTLSNLWDTQTDFSKGQFFGSTVTVLGILTTSATTYGNVQNPPGIDTFKYITPNGTLQGDAGATLSPSTTFYGPYQLTFDPNPISRVGNNDRVFVNKLLIANTETLGSCALKFASVTVYNGMTNELQKSTVTNFGGVLNSNAQVTFQNQNPIFDGRDVNNSSISIKIEGCGFTIAPFITSLQLSFIPSTTYQYISDVATISMVTAWGSFNSVNTTNGGLINFYVRNATSVVNISTQVWSSIVPGGVIAAPTNRNYIQWASTMFSISPPPIATEIDNVMIDHIEGVGSFNRAFAIDWKNRYWLATSTDGGDVLSLIYLKSKVTNEVPDAWMPVQGINIRCFAKDNNVLYGGSSSTGSVYRLDYGTNYDGRPIDFIYHTPDMVLGSPYASKDVQNYLLDASRQSGLTLNVATSIDFAVFSVKTVPLTGTGRSTTVIKGVTNPAKTLRVALYHSLLDKQFIIDDFTVLYRPTAILEPK